MDQGNYDEIPTIGDALHLAATARYTARLGGPPTEDVEPSTEQYTGVVHIISLDAPPYVDFSILGPYAVRNKKRMKLSGFHISDDGTLEKCEIFGPPSIDAWSRAYKVLRTVLVSLG